MHSESKPITDVSALLQKEKGYLRSLVSQMVPPSEVDDVLQQILIKAVRAKDGFRGSSELRTWLHQIAKNTALDFLKSRQHREQGLNVCLPESQDGSAPCDCEKMPAQESVAAAQLEKAEMSACIREYVLRLAPSYRQVIELKDFYGMTSAEIAEQLGIELPAVKIRLHRARAALRKLLLEGCELYTTSENTPGCDRKSGGSCREDGSCG